MGAPSYSSLVRQAISSERFESYRQAGDTDFAHIGRYIWNMALAEALYPALQALEVAIRNSLHGSISARYGAQWYNNSALVADPWARGEVDKAKERLTKLGRPHDPGRVIASLEFGFWTDLLHVKYEQGPRRPPSESLWPFLLRRVFPYAPKLVTTRQFLSQRLEGLRDLRNRTFHHEPIWKGRTDYSGKLVRLVDDHQVIVETTSWISPALGRAASLLDRFPQVWKAGPNPYSLLVEDYCSQAGYVP